MRVVIKPLVNMRPVTSFAVFVLILIANLPSSLQKGKEEKKKDIRDYSDADFERLYEQWEEDEEELPEDEKPEHLKVSLAHIQK